MKILTYISFSSILYLFIFSSTAQTRFNKRYVRTGELAKGQSVYINSEGDISAIYLGIGGDNNQFITCFMTFDDFGEEMDSDCVGIGWGYLGLLSEGDGVSEIPNAIQAGSQVDEEDISGAFYNIYADNGEIIRFHHFRNPWWSGDPEDGQTQIMLPRDFYLDENQWVFLCYGGDAFADSDIDTGIICFDENDEYQWHLDWTTPLTEQFFAITKLNGYLYAALERWPTEQVVDNVIIVYKIDMSGSIVEQWTEPWELNVTDVNELINDANNLVFVGATVEGVGIPSDALIFKVDENMALQWSTIIDNQEEEFRRQFEDITITTDGNYVVSGQYPYLLEETDPVNGDSMDDAWLAKFDSSTGDLMWERYYRLIETTWKEHNVYDVKATPDGGVAFTGEALDFTQEEYTAENPLQQGWIVKVDEFGCLVEGCQLVGIAEQSSDAPNYFKFGPNPISEGQSLNLYLGVNLSNTAQFKLYDLQGRAVASIDAGFKGLTQLWSVPSLSSGSYVLQLQENGKVLQSEVVVVERCLR